LLRWGYETQPEKAFTRIIQQACARIRRRWHTSRLVLAGESAGACIVFEFLAHARTHLDAAVLINGEYRSPSSACVPPTLFVVSTEDDVVEINSAVAAFDALRAGGAPVERCYVSDGHRWRHACSARKVAGAIRKMLRAAFVVV
jgi:predicted esterase